MNAATPLNNVLHLGDLVTCKARNNGGKPFFGRVVSLQWMPAAHGMKATQRAHARNVKPGTWEDAANGEPVRSIETASRNFTRVHPSQVPA